MARASTALAQPQIVPLQYNFSANADLPPGVIVGGFAQPYLDNTGAILVESYVTGQGVTSSNDDIILYGRPGDFHLLVREGQPAPQPPGGTYNTIFFAELARDGQINFQASSAIFGGLFGNLATKAYNGQPLSAPELPAGSTVYPRYTFPKHALGGFSVFNGAARLPSAGSISCVLRVGPGGAFTAQADGKQAAEMPPGVVWRSANFPTVNGSGVVAFQADLSGSGVTGTNDTAIWTGQPGAMHVAIREDQPAPIADLRYASLGEPLIGASGEIFLEASLRGTGVSTSNDLALVHGAGSSFAVVAREGTSPPSAPDAASYSSFSKLYISDRGHAAFAAQLTNTTTDRDWGMWFVGDGEITRKICREGDEIPQAPGLVFSDLSAGYPIFGANDWIAFLAPVAGNGVTTSNDLGLFAWHPDKGMILVFREGQAITLTDGLNKVISGFAYDTPNAQGNLALRLSFTDGTGGIFEVSGALPEPGMALAPILFWLASAMRWRR